VKWDYYRLTYSGEGGNNTLSLYSLDVTNLLSPMNYIHTTVTVDSLSLADILNIISKYILEGFGVGKEVRLIVCSYSN